MMIASARHPLLSSPAEALAAAARLRAALPLLARHRIADDPSECEAASPPTALPACGSRVVIAAGQYAGQAGVRRKRSGSRVVVDLEVGPRIIVAISRVVAA